MPTKNATHKKYLLNEQLVFINSNEFPDGDYLQRIGQQIKQTVLSNNNQIRELGHGMYLLTISKPHFNDPLRFKKLADRTQYFKLPELNDHESFAKVSLTQLKNLAHAHGHSIASEPYNFLKQQLDCHMIFFFNIQHVLRQLQERLHAEPLVITEVLTNNVAIVSDHRYHWPVSLAKLVAFSIWRNQPLDTIIDEEITALHKRSHIADDVLAALERAFPDHVWQLCNGKLSFHDNNTSQPFDYVSLVDDVIFARFHERIDDYLKHFKVRELNCMSSFPTVTIRSLVHLRARPSSLHMVENGYAVVAAVEGNGKQSPITSDGQHQGSTFSLWMNRAMRHLARHRYQARVVLSGNDSTCAFSLVGEQVATIALFPALVKGVFEHLNLRPPSSVRLIAHHEDVLTIASDTASWVEINEVNERATDLLRLIASDGSDPVSLFEQILLPGVGAGMFRLHTVPEAFFDLISTTKAQEFSLSPGHHHYLLGLAYQCLREWGLATEQFQKSLRFDAHDPDIHHALGCALMEIGQVTEALPFLKRAFDLMPEDAEVANDWGRSNLECGHLTDAIVAFERAVKLSPGSADYLKNLGHGYLKADRTREALAELEKAIRCDPHLADAHKTLANLYLADGDKEQAKKHAMMAFNENPLDASIANILWQITLGK